MEHLSNMEILREMILKYELPQNDMVLFGVVCPYCGKNDRIRFLESPEGLEGKVEDVYLRCYRVLWEEMVQKGQKLAVCKFCYNVIGFEEDTFKAVALY